MAIIGKSDSLNLQYQNNRWNRTSRINWRRDGYDQSSRPGVMTIAIGKKWPVNFQNCEDHPGSPCLKWLKTHALNQ